MKEISQYKVYRHLHIHTLCRCESFDSVHTHACTKYQQVRTHHTYTPHTTNKYTPSEVWETSTTSSPPPLPSLLLTPPTSHPHPDPTMQPARDWQQFFPLHPPSLPHRSNYCPSLSDLHLALPLPPVSLYPQLKHDYFDVLASDELLLQPLMLSSPHPDLAPQARPCSAE